MLLAVLCHWKPGPEQHGPARIDFLSDRRTQRRRPSEKKAGWAWNSKKRTNIWILASKKGSIGALQCTTHVESCVSVMWLTVNPCIIFNFAGCLCAFRCMFFAGHPWGSRLGLSVGSSRMQSGKISEPDDLVALLYRSSYQFNSIHAALLWDLRNQRDQRLLFLWHAHLVEWLLLCGSSCKSAGNQRIGFCVCNRADCRRKAWFSGASIGKPRARVGLWMMSGRTIMLSPSKSPTLVLLARCAWIQLPTIWFWGLCDSTAYMLHLRNYQ